MYISIYPPSCVSAFSPPSGPSAVKFPPRQEGAGADSLGLVAQAHSFGAGRAAAGAAALERER
eukprot:4058870-Pyramimonas_sp.AAC.1